MPKSIEKLKSEFEDDIVKRINEILRRTGRSAHLAFKTIDEIKNAKITNQIKGTRTIDDLISIHNELDNLKVESVVGLEIYLNEIKKIVKGNIDWLNAKNSKNKKLPEYKTIELLDKHLKAVEEILKIAKEKEEARKKEEAERAARLVKEAKEKQILEKKEQERKKLEQEAKLEAARKAQFVTPDIMSDIFGKDQAQNDQSTNTGGAGTDSPTPTTNDKKDVKKTAIEKNVQKTGEENDLQNKVSTLTVVKTSQPTVTDAQAIAAAAALRRYAEHLRNTDWLSWFLIPLKIKRTKRYKAEQLEALATEISKPILSGEDFKKAIRDKRANDKRLIQSCFWHKGPYTQNLLNNVLDDEPNNYINTPKKK